jgi:hypothetical protein
MKTDNELIAKFMGITIITDGISLFDTDFKPLKDYDKSWDYLMLVVEKIETLDNLGGIVNIVQGQCTIKSRMAGDHSVYANKSNYMLMGVKGKLLSTYQAVVEFIKWYNQQKLCKQNLE